MNKFGVDDLVLLEHVAEQDIVSTLKSRFENDLIYTYIGQVLIAVNPYRMIGGLYGNNIIKNYQGRYFFEEPPHVYAIAEDAYHSLLTEGLNQCIIITGESGSGKTESSKFIMHYIAAVTGKAKNVEKIKDQILESNPVLEAFGNAKTVQNNNSSRFGKYFQIQFNYDGDPTGGRITNYLLEKSRVVTQAPDERTFHIFYQLLTGSSEKSQYRLSGPENFRYLKQSGCTKVSGVDDTEEFKHTKKAMTVIGISEQRQNDIFKILAAILHLGNLEFKAGTKGKDSSDVSSSRSDLEFAASLLGSNASMLADALTTRTVSTGGARSSAYQVPLSPDSAAYTRDALAKAVYSRLFDWLVTTINENICDPTSEFNIGVLDIYGFEIFKLNSFEQLCINYVNEKLQQIFIELTLKSEQEEYVREKIQWTNIDYINNLPCVELIEKKTGVFGILDEESVFPKGTDQTFLEKLNRTCTSSSYYQMPSDARQKGIFLIKHYAGDVTYTVDSFLDKNKDTLFNNLRDMLQSSTSEFVRTLFPKENASDNKRPLTSVVQFKNQVIALVETLMSCTPHYIRCIRPNAQKQSKNYDVSLCTAQVRYLGLLENVRVRRAGFVYRQTFERFMARFKMLSPKTWPKFTGQNKDGCVEIMNQCNIPKTAYELGLTKLFIKAPQTLFALEELRLRKLDDIVKIIQRVWRNKRGKAFYKKCTYTSVALISGRKERRSDSVFRPFLGDYIKFKGKHSLEITKKYGEKKFMFADKLQKISPKLTTQNRRLVITDQAIYNFGGLRSKITRRVLIRNVTGITLSTLQDDFIVIHVGSEYDMVYVSYKKTEITCIIYELYRELTDKSLPVNFSDQITFSLKGGKTRTIQFQKDESAQPLPKWKKNGENLVVSVATGLEKSSGRKAREPPKKGHDLKGINRTGQGNKAPQTKFIAVARVDYTAKSARELSFKAGDRINVTKRDTSGWWQGELKGNRGMFPASHVELEN